MDEFVVLASPIQPHLYTLLSNCREQLLVSSPFIKKSAIDWLVEIKPTSLHKISVLTNLSLQSIISNSLEISALRQVFEAFQDASIFSLQNLHAKIFIADDEEAIITSANFTNGGLWTNYEYGVAIRNKQMIRKIIEDVTSYQSLGGMVSPKLLDSIEENVSALVKTQRKAETDPSTKAIRREIRDYQRVIQDALLSNRVDKGRTINRIFSDTIVLILKRKKEGMSTKQIHGEIKNIHPDICDDSIDRVINGQHFGKKWKHYVRRAQEFLKAKNIIFNHSGTWRLKEYAS